MTLIWTLLDEAADEHRRTGAVSTDLQSRLLAEGYNLRNLADDIRNLNANF